MQIGTSGPERMGATMARRLLQAVVHPAFGGHTETHA